jgi:hypothetical protein
MKDFLEAFPWALRPQHTYPLAFEVESAERPLTDHKRSSIALN